jgi:hypothetical protein
MSWNNRTQLYFSAFPNKDAVLAPPLDSTNLVITGTNLPAISGDRPSLWNASATSAIAGAAFNRPFIPGTAADTLLNSSPLRRLLANARLPVLSVSPYVRIFWLPHMSARVRALRQLHPGDLRADAGFGQLGCYVTTEIEVFSKRVDQAHWTSAQNRVWRLAVRGPSAFQ